MVKKNLHIVMVQSSIITENCSENLKNYSKILESAPECDLILFPEMFNTGFSTGDMSVSESVDGEAITWIKKMAAKYQTAISATILINDDNSFYNRFYLCRKDGSLDFYDKKHLFGFGGESRYITAGEKQTIFELNGWKILPQVCYDLRFPVFSRNSFSNDTFGYDIAIYLANWPASRTKIWRTLLSARAIENQAYIVGVNRTGRDKNQTPHNGNSLVAHPDGSILADLGDEDTKMKLVILNYKELSEFRNRFPFALDWDSFKF